MNTISSSNNNNIAAAADDIANIDLSPLIIFIQKYHFCHHFMVNITYNPTINLFCFYAPPMGHSFNPLLHQPLIPPLDQQMSCHFTDIYPSLLNRFHLAG